MAAVTVSIIMPFGGACEFRTRNRDFVAERYRRLHPTWQLIEGHSPDPWRKGVAAADAVAQSTGEVLVIADADSFIDPDVLEEAAELAPEVPWVVPHTRVFRLNRSATQQNMNGVARRAPVVRRPYLGPAGGGIVALTREAWDAVHGIDVRFVDWGGEDVSFARALDTLVGPHVRLTGDLFHLWHPPAAPRGRGSLATEALANQYRSAINIPRRMRALVEHRDPGPAPTLDPPAVFRSVAEHRTVRAAGQVCRFHDHQYTTADADLAEALRRTDHIEEVTDASRLVRR